MSLTPAVPNGVRTAGVPAPQLHLPALRPEDNRRYLLWSTDGFPKMVNGRSSITPKRTQQIFASVNTFPDQASVAALRRLGLRTVVLHADRLAGTPWQDWRARPVAALGITRRVAGNLVVYDLR